MAAARPPFAGAPPTATQPQPGSVAVFASTPPVVELPTPTLAAPPEPVVAALLLVAPPVPVEPAVPVPSGGGVTSQSPSECSRAPFARFAEGRVRAQ